MALLAPCVPAPLPNLALDSVLFTEYPENDSGLSSRLIPFRAIQGAAKPLPALAYLRYVRSWDSAPAQADSLELKFPILKFLRKSTEQAMADISNARVDSGLVCWHLYNMGYVFKTSSVCFGVDLHFRGAEKLAGTLDFLLVTHGHIDHYTAALLDAMLKQNKPVFTNYLSGSHQIKHDTAFSIDGCGIRAQIGDHHRHLPLLSTNNMLMFQITCPSSGRTFRIYDSGDGNGIGKMKPDGPIDVYIVHAELPMPMARAVYHVKPAVTFASHLMELGHPFPMRWDYDYGYREIAKIKGYNVIILGWGERWMSPGTRVRRD